MLTLSKVLSVENIQETLSGILNALGDGLLDDELSASYPLADVLLVLSGVLGAKLLVTDNESLRYSVSHLCDRADSRDSITYFHLDPLGHDVHQVFGEVHIGGVGQVVVRDHTAHDEASMVVGGLKGRLEGLTSDVLEVDVDSLRSKLLQRLLVRGGLVVEGMVELELVLDELGLLVAADGADHGEPLVLGELADDLADGSRGGRDEDGLALLGLSDLVEGRARSTTSDTVPTLDPME